MILKCQVRQELLLNIINAKASRGQHKPLVLSKALIAGFLHLRLQFPRDQRSQLGARVWFFPLFFGL